MRWTVLVAGLALAAPAPAVASGGGLGGTYAGRGASAPGGEFTYVAMPGQGARTVIQQVRRAGGEIPRWRDLKGRYGVPAAAYDGSTTGLSADGRTLVLVELASTYPPDRTRLLVLDAPTLRHRTLLDLPGYSSVDAVSPDGRWIYLVRYTAPLRDINRYEVVAYDLLNPGAPEPIVDPEEPDEQMGGMPLSRAVSPDGRFVYTLYGAEEPFIHALDTEGRTAKCIDLPQFAGQDISSLRIGLVDGEVRLMRGAKTVAVVAKGARVAAVVPARAPVPRGGSNTPWALAAIPAALLLAWTARAWWRRRVRAAL